MKIGLIVFGVLILIAIYTVWNFSFPTIEAVGFELNFLFWATIFIGTLFGMVYGLAMIINGLELSVFKQEKTQEV